MAKIILGPMVGAASGSIGATTFSHNRYGTYTRRRAIPVKSNTIPATNAKARFTSRSQAWQLESEGTRLAWREWALDHPITDTLGQQQTLQPNAAYIRLNTRLEAVGLAPIVLPPVDAPPTGLQSLVVDGDIGLGDVDIEFTVTPLEATHFLNIWAAVVDSAGITYVENLIRQVGISAAAATSPFDIQALVEDRFGTLIVGQTLHVQVSVIDSATGLVSGALRSKVIITTT